jgi:glycosyltransferase involved in cell wall biosynthesis
MSNPDISIIVPVYNSEKYLNRCVYSLINQTLYSIEIILIDDGSTDKSEEICKSFSIHDTRVNYYKQQNSGQSIARNKGLELATAPYLMFVDSDDWIDTDTCECLLETINREDADIVMFTYSREYETRSLKKTIFKGDRVFNEQECRALHRRFAGIIGEELKNPENSDNLAPVCTKLYKKSIITGNKLFFEDIREIISYEDGLFNLSYFKYVKKSIYLDRDFYKYWRSNMKSTTKRYYEDLIPKFKVLFQKIEIYILLNNLPDEFYQGLNNRIALNLITVSLKTVSDSSPLSFSEKQEYLANVLNDKVYFSALNKLKTNYMPIHWKMFYWAAQNKLSIILLFLALIIKHKVSR